MNDSEPNPESVPTDGLDALRAQIGSLEIASLIERTARWVAPETFIRLPVWYPEHARGALFYKSNWSEPQMNRKQSTGASAHKFEGNVYANAALTFALGLRKQERPNWSCCHIWGLDDARYQSANVVVQDRRFYSCVGNMVLLPMPLKAFTDSMPEIKAMLRICAHSLYGWQCDHEDLNEINFNLETWTDSGSYPESWPRHSSDGKRPLGVVDFNDKIDRAAKARLDAIKDDLKNAGPFYPREQVMLALDYWRISLE